MNDARPLDGITGREAAEILGVTSHVYVYQLVSESVIPRRAPKHTPEALSREDVERVSLERLRRGEPHPYRATRREAAEILSVTRNRVLQLVQADLIPAVRHNGWWYFRRPQVEVVANARDARWHTGPIG